jgi:hypothetical protein
MSKPIDMTIHWKVLEEHFLMETSVFRFTHFRGKMHFLNFTQDISDLEKAFDIVKHFPSFQRSVRILNTVTQSRIGGNLLTAMWCHHWLSY